MSGYSKFNSSVLDWVALRTSAQWEKQIASMLTSACVPVYLPTITRITHYATKTQSVEVPMFSGYVFCSVSNFIDNPAIPRACRAKVAQILVPPSPNLLRKELEHIASVCQNRRVIQESIYGGIGARVRIRKGSFAGHEGVVLEQRPNRHRLVLEISFLNTKLEVEVEETQVEKV